jgi:CspA family cold shock protein|tara:strand:+ start:493 stop:798 length:306 start_codon:yes stop_codon:yes gene_type:complete
MITGNVAAKTIGLVTGTVKWFNNAKGYGFIVADGKSEDMFAHYSAITMDGYKTLKAGQAVTFDTKAVDGGIHAVNISTIAQPVSDESMLEESTANELEEVS